MIYNDYKLQVETVLDLKNKGWDTTRIAYYIMVDSMKWSFSRLNSWYDGCRYCWFQNYILKRRDGVNNVFAEYGLIIHEILEKYLANELSIMELEDEFEKGFAKLGDFPPNQYVDLKTTYYKSGIKYLNNPDMPSIYEVVEIEKEVNTTIGKYSFVGYIDLVLRHKKSGKIALLDHKSKSKFDKDTNEIYKYARQMYLYSKAIFEEFGEYPSMLIFNRFRKQEFDRIKFNLDDYKEAQQWALDQIEDAKNATDFKVTEDEFFGEFLCNYRLDNFHIGGVNLLLEDGLNKVHLEV